MAVSNDWKIIKVPNNPLLHVETQPVTKVEWLAATPFSYMRTIQSRWAGQI